MASAKAPSPPPESITIPEIPDGFTLHTENTARILLPATDEAFLNPVQEFNRDLSVACIRVWSEQFDAAKEKKWRDRNARAAAGEGKEKKGKGKNAKKAKSKLETVVKVESGKEMPAALDVPMSDEPNERATSVPSGSAPVGAEVKTDTTQVATYRPHRFVLLEALSATGLRAIRYAKEIPLVKYVIANDISPVAVEAIKRNVELNGLGDKTEASASSAESEERQEGKGDTTRTETTPKRGAKVQINAGDACSLMYSHRPDRVKVDCVDLDPYGTAAPFIDAAVQCVNDGGLLCVTCTDMTVLATGAYPEKCYSNYGGVSVKAEYCHEAALRLVLHAVSTSAGRYGRYIQPLLSLSIDFYVRLFIRIQSGPAEVKKVASKTSTYYICSGCQSFYEQPLGKIVEKVSEKNGQVNYIYRQRTGPPVGDKCPECESALHVRGSTFSNHLYLVAGPMWSGPIHDKDFAAEAIAHVEANEGMYGTSARMKGMLTVAKEELDTPFYFSPTRMAGFFHCTSPSLEDTSNALLHAGFAVSRSHALAGSIKTTGTRQDVHDVFRGWVKTHPVKQESISQTSPSHRLHAKQPRFEANFASHPQAATQSSKVKLVRYQINPTPNWGPGMRATGKRKRDVGED
ncbi:N2,N2-dimethylguanosine tRNA methyltransferase, partial [Phellopilus nigrolimitatus]